MDSNALRQLAATALEGADAIDTLTAQLADRDAQIIDLRKQLAEARAVTLWGSSVARIGAETHPAAMTRVENAIGPVNIVRHFNAATMTWPTHTGDRVLHVSFKWNPADVLTGRHDTAFRDWCAKAPDRDTYWTLWHEPEDNAEAGEFTPADYRAAWRRLVPIARASGKRLHATLTLMEWTLRPESGRTWSDYYPGADVIDALAWDAYYNRGQRTPAEIFADVRRVSAAEGKPWAIAETGVAADLVPDPLERRRVLSAMARELATAQPGPVFVCYFDSPVGNASTAWNISRDPTASAAWTAGRDA